MALENGSLSIHSQNIFPIIKKWLYSDKDIFVRELVSNANDAIIKYKKLIAMGETSVEEGSKFEIKVVLDKENKTIKIIDNGIGMTCEEVKKYIAQIAFSGAEDFIEKYKDKSNKDQIIGHFGLGFYSSFMVAEKVEIDSLSYQEGAQAIKWLCDGGTEYTMDESDRTTIGTDITLFVGEEGEEFLNEYTLKSTLEKYCSFMPIEIYFENVEKEEEKKEEETSETAETETTEETTEENVEDDIEDLEEVPSPINDTVPLWNKKPSECTDEEYKEFYKKVFMDFNEPLFWIHLNMDYPLNLKGILYFPKLKNEFETIEGKIKLYSNQVFVADNIKEVIPEFLLLLKGAIDCPELPLNVSRSFLQNDGYVSKISSYITKKVADKLKSLYKNDKDNFIKFWDDINPFIKYGVLKEEKFYDKVKDILLFKTINDEYVTLPDYLEKNKEKHENTVFYVSDEMQQAQYIKLFKDQDMEAVILSSSIDNPFISHIESKNTGVTFKRVDSDLTDNMKSDNEENSEELQKDLEELFKKELSNENLKVKVESLKSDSISAIILLSEQSRRMQEMTKMFGNGMNLGMFPEEQTLVLNRSNSLIQKVLSLKDSEDKKEDLNILCNHIYDLAMLSHKPLNADAMTKFIERSQLILEKF